MNRRSFVRNAGAVSAYLASTASLSAQAADGTSVMAGKVGLSLPPALVGQQAREAYFTEERLYDALGTKTLLQPKDVTTIAYNFPSWHPSPFMETRFGKGWTEFDLLRNARSLFPGHSMPHYPLWGYYDESDPVWAAREIDLAANYGIDAWLIDWYWHEGTQLYHEQLESGFLRAANRNKLKFAVMWANHDWKNVYPARSPDQAAVMLPQVHTIQDFEHVATYCCEHYFDQGNYLRLDEAPLFTLFDPSKVLSQLGVYGLQAGLSRMRERAHKLGFPKLHLQAANGYDAHEAQLKNFGFDSAAQYGTFAWTYGSKPVSSRLPYGVGAVEAIASWKHKRENVALPFYPCVSVGWDDSPRFGEFASVAINRSPDQFERLLRAARHTIADAPEEKLVYIAAWNEWTEDHMLLPDTYWGYSYLEAVKRTVQS